MTHAAAPSSSSPTPNTHAQSSAAKAAQAQAGARGTDGHAKPADLFASLLALVADAPALQSEAQNLTPNDGPVAPQDADAASSDTEDPLSALMAWMQPGLMPAAPQSDPSNRPTSEPQGPEVRADRLTLHPDDGRSQGKATDLPALTAETRRIDGAAERQGAIALPAAVPTHARAMAPAWLAGTTRPVAALADKNTIAGSDIAMRWQRGASPEQASTTGLSMRSTVELGERRTAHGAPTWAAAVREASHEIDEGSPGLGSAQQARWTSEGPTAVTAPASGSGADLGGGDTGAADGQPSDHRAQESASDPLRHSDGQDEAVEVRHWGTGELRNASLRVGDNGEQAIDIQLSMRGDEVQVAFRTDDENARELLRQQANDSLGQLLKDSGISLGGVSVGSHGQPTGGDAMPQSTVAKAEARARSDDGTDTIPNAHSPRTDGGTGLDLFI